MLDELLKKIKKNGEKALISGATQVAKMEMNSIKNSGKNMAKSEISSTISQIDSMMSQIESVWEGKTSKNLVTKVTQENKKLKQVID